MTILSVYQDTVPGQPFKVLTHVEDIAATLAEVGVQLERLEAGPSIAAGTSTEEVIAAYRPQIDHLMQARGYSSVEVISWSSDQAQKAEPRTPTPEEHWHDGDEVRYFVAGRGLYSLHIGDRVYAVQCEKNDLISVPANTRKWFDPGEQPHLVAICLFSNPQAQGANTTGADIAGRFPRLED